MRSLDQATTRKYVTHLEDKVQKEREMDSFPSMDDVSRLSKSPTFLLKILELVLNIFAIILFVSDSTSLMLVRSKWAVLLGTLIGFLMVSIIIILTALLKHPLPRPMIMMIALPAAFMFFATGGIMMEQYSNIGNSTGCLLTAGIICFMNGFTYLWHFVLIFRYYRR